MGRRCRRLSDIAPAGGIESLTNLKLGAGGTYFLRVTAADDTIQMYQLSLAVAALLRRLRRERRRESGRSDEVEGGIRRGERATHTQGDANGDGRVDGDDFLVWQSELGSNSTFSAVASVPEPASCLLTLGVAIVMGSRRMSRRVRSISAASGAL